MLSKWAHPRVGGENKASDGEDIAEYGSSPRGRGKPFVVGAAGFGPGLIPAWAGKTPSSRPRSTERRAHPRVGGENRQPPPYGAVRVGSSPRGRGKLIPRAGIPGVAGLIPAWAGKTPPGQHTAARSRAHPRVGGENVMSDNLMPDPYGSSPRGRGKQRRVDASRAQAMAHPRVGGENS